MADEASEASEASEAWKALKATALEKAYKSMKSKLYYNTLKAERPEVFYAWLESNKNYAREWRKARRSETKSKYGKKVFIEALSKLTLKHTIDFK
jgi:hypothetical protein